MTIEDLIAKQQEARDSALAIYDAAEKDNDGEGRELTEDEQTASDGHYENVKAFDKRIESQRRRDELTAPEGRKIIPPLAPVDNPNRPGQATSTRMAVSAEPRRYAGHLKHFKNRAGRTYKYPPEERAFRWIQPILAKAGNPNSLRWCHENLSESRVHQGNINFVGGSLVADQFDTDIIDLQEEFGVFRQFARRSVMDSDVKTRPRVSSRLEAFFVGEDAAGTESTGTFDQVTLTAKKLMIITRITNELNEDAMISMADWAIGDIARKFAEKEDNCGFNGVGTQTFGGIKGLINVGAAGTTSMTATHDTAAEFLLADIIAGMAKLPSYADNDNTRLFMHKFFFHAAFDRLASAAGGTTRMQTFQDKWVPSFNGYPVVFAQKMPGSDAQTTIFAYFGDLSMAADFGDRRELTITLSDNAVVNSVSVFERDELALRGTERFDINAHDIGDGSNAGPIVALKSGTT